MGLAKTKRESVEQISHGRILVVDDNEKIRADFKKILGTNNANAGLGKAEQQLFGRSKRQNTVDRIYHLEFASQGEEAIQIASNAVANQTPFDLAFVDVRMPPGMDGIMTAQELWKLDRELQIVVCTAYSDYEWTQIVDSLGQRDGLIILKKPFDIVEVSQLALALVEKRRLVKENTLRTNQLEETIQERTDQLAEALREAKVAVRAKNEFLTSVSHRFRTPLTSIIGNAETYFSLSSADNLSHEQAQAVSEISTCSHQLLRLLNEILDLCQLEEGVFKTNKTTFIPTQLASDVCSAFQYEAERKSLSLAYQVSDDVPRCCTSDTKCVKQILTNLVTNAIKFTDHGEIMVHVQSTPSQLLFRVQDTGIGIAEDKLEQIFAPFGQFEGSRIHTTASTGLGLTFSRKVAQALGGDISVTSIPDMGSTFTLAIPLRIDDPSDASSTQTSLNQSNVNDRGTNEFDSASCTDKRTQPLKLLLIEDDQVVQRFIVAMLKMAGIQTQLAHDGKQGFDEAMRQWNAGNPFDVVLMDMQMPVLDGYQATRKLRKNGYEGPIIALTANALSEDREKCLIAGCDDYVTKPIDRHQLLQSICALTAKSLHA